MGVRVRVRVVAVRVNPNLGQERHDPLAAPRRAHERGGEPRVRAEMQVAVGRHGAPRQDGALGRLVRLRVRVRVRVRVRFSVRVRVRVWVWVWVWVWVRVPRVRVRVS